MADTVSLIGTATADVADNVTTFTITVPTGVTTAHLGVLVFSTADAGAHTITVPSWTARVQNPTGEGNTEVTILTRLGGHAAGGTITCTVVGGASAARFTAAWYDTQSRDVQTVGTPFTRNATASTALTFPGVSVSGSRNVLLAGAERTAGTGLTVSSWSPSTPTVDLYARSADTALRATGHLLAHFTQATAGTTPSYTATISASSSNAVGVQLVLAPGAPDNTAPVANAGPDQTVEPWSTVTLTGTETDADSNVTTRAWTQVSGTAMTLAGTGATRTFTAPGTLAGITLTFRYTVTDSAAATGTDDVVITVLPASERVMIGGSWVPALMRTI